MSLLAAVLWSALLAVLIAKATLEEHWLMQRYPEYASYRAGTWRLLPWVF
jgi:protein-S-isoprenylcysteine O-methyltransferase Ste14